MRFKSVKNAKDLALAGIAFEIEQVDGSVQSLSMTDSDGNLVRLSLRSYSLQIEIPAPPKTVKQWQLSGTVLGLPVSLNFKNDYEAKGALEKYRNAAYDVSLVQLEVAPVEVPEDSADELIVDEAALPF